MVASVGDSTDPNVFGGLPYHLVSAGKLLGVIDEGFAFNVRSARLKASRVAWNILMLGKYGRAGGFQYSECFLDLLWSSVATPPKPYDVLNVFQLYPEAEMNRTGSRFFYLDQTLHDVFNYYGTASNITPKFVDSVLQRESSQYQAADRVIFRSNWALKSAFDKYGLLPDKVAVVLPGANLDAAVLHNVDNSDPPKASNDDTLRLVFIGKDWLRKGLDRLLEAMHLAKEGGAKIKLSVIGVAAKDLPPHLTRNLDISWFGFLDKSRSPSAFVRIVADNDFGVLLSRTEAGGVSLREFGRLGLPVIAPDTGGSPEFAMSDTAQLVKPSDDVEKIATMLISLCQSRKVVDEMRIDAWHKRNRFDWSVAVRKLKLVIGY